MSFKRPRTPSHSSSSSSSSRGHTFKASRTSPDPTTGSTRHPLLCTLPPTCTHRPTPIANSRDLEVHYATYHAHVCEMRGCGCVFPDARLLELHQTECHDPLAAVRKDRGEKIFACHLASCSRLFLTPKARRLHLIQAHAFPKEYFFAVTNKGVGGLLKRWGDGASMIRGQWKAREGQGEGIADGEGKESSRYDGNIDGNDGMTVDEVEEGDDSSEENHGVDVNANDAETQNTYQHQHSPPPLQSKKPAPTPAGDQFLDTLTQSLDSLSLVPPSIRFGRGGKRGGFSGHSHSIHSVQNRVAEEDVGRAREADGKPDRSTTTSNGDISLNVLPRQMVSTGRGVKRGRGRGWVVSAHGMGVGAGIGVMVRGRGGWGRARGKGGS